MQVGEGDSFRFFLLVESDTQNETGALMESQTINGDVPEVIQDADMEEG